MSRDLEDEDYYVSHGGKIPVKWTAPEVCIIVCYTCKYRHTPCIGRQLKWYNYTFIYFRLNQVLVCSWFSLNSMNQTIMKHYMFDISLRECYKFHKILHQQCSFIKQAIQPCLLSCATGTYRLFTQSWVLYIIYNTYVWIVRVGTISSDIVSCAWMVT